MGKISYRIMYRDHRMKKDGSYAVVLRTTIKRKIKFFSLDFDVLPKNFVDGQIPYVKKSDAKFHNKNLAISNAIKKITDIEHHFLRFDKEPTVEEFEKMFYSQHGNPECFYAYAESMKVRRNGKLADATIDFYDKHIGKLKKFRTKLSMGDVDPDFLYAYRDHCVKLKNNENTLNKSLEFVRRVMNAALRDGRITKTPFINFPIKNPKGDTAHLTIDELQQMEKKYKEGTLPKACQNVLRYFLFACYTGLRYADVQNLQFSNLVEDKGSNWLHFVQQKTGKQTQVYLMPQAMALIPVQDFKNQRMFRVVPNQTTNRHLKEISQSLEWEKRITFHVARHTCSNLLYQLGVPIEIRSKIVGDTAKVLQDHYTRTDSDMIKKAISDFSEAIAKAV